MTFNRPGPLEEASRMWRTDRAPIGDGGEGPLALLRLMIALAWRNKIRLVACTAAGFLLAFLYANSLPKVYNATATLLLEPRQFASAGRDISGQQNLDLNSAESELQIIRSERLLSAVFDSLVLQGDAELGPRPPKEFSGLAVQVQDTVSTLVDNGLTTLGKTSRRAEDALDPTADPRENARRIAFANFVKRLSARRVGQSYVVEIEFWSYNQNLPARVANAMASGYILQSIASKEQMARAGTDTLQGRLDALAAQVNAAREAMRNGTLPVLATPDADARIIGAALPPLDPSGPRKTLIAALGGLLGFLIGMSTIAVNVAFDRRVRDTKELSQEAGIPCLATVPDTGKTAGIGWHFDSPALQRYASVIRDLKTSVDVACASQRRERNIVIAFIGATAATGVSTLSLSMAQLLSRSGHHVTFFYSGLPSMVEETSSSSTSLADVAISGLKADQLSFGNLDGIATLPIHSTDPHIDIFADFRHPSVLRILETARLKGDVIFDLPALDTSLDALALAFHADAVLIVAKSGRTTIDEVKDVHNQLRRAGAPVIGTVVNRVRS
ncbi:CobQ/CobB/MinD/ParA nucleotide binding domain-containing protein [Neorhizobium galegae bv. orientalis]|nr:exopolysaccharide biosynthesis protein [Neorhizobium galegae]CDZ64482.1 CobQ/CobB/MinD/ParA nucleotide binding domain-containing protein [Neorhizobium galegae bv. orientalis]CDZ73689.1 CobQ/CobB/MinD/ParA nucleotide binding domain-containing protein [Neorhizobium galegae bv. orientalis]